jgi:hypothetical protein
MISGLDIILRRIRLSRETQNCNIAASRGYINVIEIEEALQGVSVFVLDESEHIMAGNSFVGSSVNVFSVSYADNNNDQNTVFQCEDYPVISGSYPIEIVGARDL